MVPAHGTIPYGEALTVVANVSQTPGHAPVTAGTVDFTENGTSVQPEGATSAICQSVPVVQGTASCVLSALAASATPYRFGASFTPAPGTLHASRVTVSQGAEVTVVPASTTITLTGAPDASSPGNVRLVATVSDGSSGSNLPPTGTVSFRQGNVALTCAQASAILTETSASASTEVCDVPAPSETTTYTARYVPTDATDFGPSGPAPVSVAPSAVPAAPGVTGGGLSPLVAPPRSSASKSSGTVTAHDTCSSVFGQLWIDSGGTLTFTGPLNSLGSSASLTVTSSPQSGTCTSTTSIAFSSATLSLFGGTLTGSSLSGTITDGSPDPQLCITAGTLEGVSISGSLCFSVSAATTSGGTIDGITSASLSASGSLSIASVASLSVSTITISNLAPPTADNCSLKNSGDWWLFVGGNLSLSISQSTLTETATGCVDLTSGTSALSLTSTFTGLAIGPVTLNSLTVTLSYASGTGFGVQGTAAVSIAMPSGGTLSTTLTVAFQSSGTVVVGGEANLSSWLGSSWSGTAYLYYATAAVSSFDTGVSSLGNLDLVQGINFAISLTGLPSSISSALQNVGINMTGTLLATGSYDTSSGTFTLAITYTFPTSPPVQLFDNQGVALDLVSATVAFETTASSASINLTMNATLYPNGTAAGAQAVPVSGTLSAAISSTPSASISVSINEPGCALGGGWTNAFGDNGLTVQCAELTVGVTAAFPYVTGSIQGVITSLPSDIATAIGYQDGAPIAFAFGFNPYYLDLSIGTPTSTTTALEPLASFGYGSALQVSYAQLCFAEGAVLLPDGLGCNNGFVLAFSATIDSSIFAKPVSVNVSASLSISNPVSLDFSASISQIIVGSDLIVAPVTLVVCASTAQSCANGTSNFQFEFDGSASLSGSVTVPNAVQLSGSLSLSLSVDLSTGGFSAFVSGSVSGSISVWNPFTNCSGVWYNPTTWHCDGSWGSSSTVSQSLGTTGIAVGSTGLTVMINGYSVTFPFNSNDPPSAPIPSTSTTLTSSVGGTSSTTSTYGQSVVLTATVTASGATFDGLGSVSFYIGAEPIAGCSGTSAVALQDVSGSYTATCTTSQAVVPSSNDTMILPGGSDAIVAEYSGDANFPPAESASVTETVNAATPTLTVSATPSLDFYGQSLSLSVGVSPTDGGGTVTFLDNGVNIAGCVGLSLTGDAGLGLGTDDSAGATCSVGSSWSAGTYPITVSYSGDASATQAVSAVDNVVVHKDNTSATVSESPTTVTYGNESASTFTVTVTTAHGEQMPFTESVIVHVGAASCTASVAPATGGGTGTCSIANTALGASTTPYAVKTTYPGDADLNASGLATSPTGLTVIKDNTTTTVTNSASAPYATETSVIFHVNVAPHYGETGPSGEHVTVTVGSTSCDVILSDGGGSCHLAIAVLPVGGPYAVSVTYPGDSNFNGSTGTNSFSVVTTSTPDCTRDAGAKLVGANFAGANLAGCDLSGANLKNADLEGASLRGANLQGANLKGAILQGDNLVGANLAGTNLMGDNVQYANLQGVDLQQANLQYANLATSYDFSGSNLEGANLQHANLLDANLEDANLSDANLHYADLAGANLTGANLQGANLLGANLTGTVT